MQTFDNLLQAMEHYKSVGYTTDFNLAFDHLICGENKIRLSPETFEIIDAIKFDESTDRGEESILYVVQSKNGDFRGTIVSAFGIYADAISKELLDKLVFHKQ